MNYSYWILTLALWAIPHIKAVQLAGHPKDMFDQSMHWLDQIYDPIAGYLYYFYFPLAAGPHETRSSVWYATGLLQRNVGDDANQAIRIIRSVIGDQQKNVSAQWYGDYTVYPEQPTVGTSWYPASIYNTWDPNWRGFIGTNLIVIYEEFGHLLPADVKDLILESMYNNTIGDSYRVGGVDDDNLYPSYSNPWLMRAVATGWTGRKLNDSNMTASGELYAKQALDLFNINDTLSEFNVPTYYGISLYALTMWAKYMPSSSIMEQNASRMIRQIWDTASLFYNPNLKNLAGPWDRSYGYDMNNYVAIFSLYIWSLLGRDFAFDANKQPWYMAHGDDSEFSPLLSVLAQFHNSLVPKEAVARLSSFMGEHTVSRTAFAPPYDNVPRNITTWLSANLTIGAESFDQIALGGAREDQSSWNPAVIQWKRSDGSVGYITLYPSETALDVAVTANELNLTYPKGNSTSTFTFIIASNPLGEKRDIAKLQDIDGLNVEISGTIDPQPQVGFCGLVGGTCDVIHDFEFWNLTFSMPAGSSEIPSVSLKVNLD